MKLSASSQFYPLPIIHYPLSSMLDSHPLGTVLSVRAYPDAKKNEIRGEQAGSLKVCITAAPEKGKANKALTEFLATQFGVRKSQVELLAGETSPQKKLLFHDVTVEEMKVLFKGTHDK